MSAAITVERLHKRYGDVVAVDELSFDVPRGEIFALLGPNGAGKTTTVEVLEGLRRPDSGEIRVLGHDPSRRLARIRGRIGVMPQSGGLWAGVRPIEALKLFAAFYDHPQDPGELAERVGLGDRLRAPWRRLSGGEQQRLSLALALVGRPEVAFLDEPTAGMDVHGRHATWETIRDLATGGTTVVLTTHLLEEAERLADRVGIIHRGRLVALGPPGELGAGAGDELRFTASADVDADALADELGTAVERAGPGRFRLHGKRIEPGLVAHLAGWLASRDVLVQELVVGRRTLEDVFLELTREER